MLFAETVRAAGGEVSAGPEIPYDCPYDWYCGSFRSGQRHRHRANPPRVTPGAQPRLPDSVSTTGTDRRTRVEPARTG